MTIRDFLLENYMDRYEFRAKHMLSASDCESFSIAELLEMGGLSADEFGRMRLGYTEVQGAPDLLRAVAGMHKSVRPENVMVAVPEEAIMLVMMALVRPGDEVVVQFPCYQSLSELASFQKGKVKHWSVVEERGRWHIDLDALEGLVTKSTRLIVVNSPHNPTGYLPTRTEFDAIVEMARKNDAWLFCDEMYRGLEYDPSARLPTAPDLYEKGVSLCGMSKTYGLPGLRIGWLAMQDEWLLRELKRYKVYTTICPAEPAQLLATVALSHGEEIIARNLGIIRANLARIYPFFEKWGDIFCWREPMAGSVAFSSLVKDPEGPDASAETFCERLAGTRSVLLVPSTCFEFGDSHIRWGLGRSNFADGLAALDAYLEEVA